MYIQIHFVDVLGPIHTLQAVLFPSAVQYEAIQLLTPRGGQFNLVKYLYDISIRQQLV